MATSNRVYHHQMDPPPPSAPSALPPWLASSSMTPTIRPPSSPSVTLTLLPTIIPPAPSIPWLQTHDNPTQFQSVGGNHLVVSELMNCCRELDEGQRAWEAHRSEAGWRLKRVELQLESEKAARRKEKMDEIEAKVKALEEEQRVALDRIEAEYREQLAGLRREAEVKEQKLAEQWAAKHLRLSMFLEQHMGCRQIGSEPNGR